MQKKLGVARVRTLKLRTQSFALGTQNVRTGKGFEWKYIGCIFNTCAYSINLLSCPQSVDIDRCTNTYLIKPFCHNFGIDKRYVKLTPLHFKTHCLFSALLFKYTTEGTCSYRMAPITKGFQLVDRSKRMFRRICACSMTQFSSQTKNTGI